MKHPRKYRIASIALAGSLIFAACGDDDDPVATEQTEEPAAAATGDDMVDMMGAFGPACDAVPTEGDGSFAGMADDPAATAASANPLLSTLVTAVSEAGLVDTLNGDGPFTIFAPTNDAFAAIPAETLDMVLADTDLLTTILTYHVVAGESLDAAALGARRLGRNGRGRRARLRRRRHHRQRRRRAVLGRSDCERHGAHHR